MRIDRLGLLAVRSALPIRAFLALIFALALIGKATSMEEFTATLQRSGLIPPTWEEASAVAILVLECLLVVASLVRSLAYFSLLGHMVLASLFFGYSTWRLYQDIQAPCNCFGLLFKLQPYQSLILTSSICFIAALGVRAISSNRPLPVSVPMISGENP